MTSSFFTQIGNDFYGRATGDILGTSVSLSSVVAIGSRGYGYVRIYQNINDTWTQVGSDLNGEDNFDYYGNSVSLSSDGSVVAIGAPSLIMQI